MKTCTKCREEKALSEFYKDPRKGREGKVRPRCKACLNAEVKARRDPEKHQIYVRKWEARNADIARRWHRTGSAKRKAAKLQAAPQWSNAEKIEEFYFAADFLGMVTGEWYHVDHIVPLQSKIVCGLHTEQNLQVIPASDNLRKSNRHWPDSP